MNSANFQTEPSTPASEADGHANKEGRVDHGPGFLGVLLIVVVSSVAVTGVMMSPVAFVTAFPPALPKTRTQLIGAMFADQGMAFDEASFDRGKASFAVNCVACHTPGGGARLGLGKDIVRSEFTAGISDKQLMTFLKTGRNPGDPLNTTGVDMPPKGGNPALNDSDLNDLITFIRGQQLAVDVTFQ